MTCHHLGSVIVCMNHFDPIKVEIEPDVFVWFEHHHNFGPFFWLDEDCTSEFDNWWDNEVLSKFVDDYYGYEKEDKHEI